MTARCFGLPVQLPADRLAGASYPWGLDATRRYPWAANIVDGQLYIRSSSCLGLVNVDCCAECSSLGDRALIRNLIDRAVKGTVSEFTTSVWLTWDNIYDKNGRLRQQLDQQKLSGLALSRKLTRIASTSNDYQRLVWAVANGTNSSQSFEVNSADALYR